MSSPVARILGLSTALPRFHASQDRISTFVVQVLRHTAPAAKREKAISLVERIFPASGIHQRYVAIPDCRADGPDQFEFFPRNWELEPFPSTARRMEVYEEVSVDLAEAASRRALAASGVHPESVTHLIVSTCTGFFAPGPDVLLLRRLGLSPSVRRTVVGFMGCYAGFSGMRLAEQTVRAEPDALVLHVCVEICSLHFQKRPEPDFVVANCLFGDGCAALVYGARDAAPGRGLVDLAASYCYVGEDTLNDMTWHIGDTGFEMRLSARVPVTLERTARPFVRSLLERAGLHREEVSAWAIHPGGRRILESVGDALGLDALDLAPSLSVLRDHGNMSSPTVFFVLDRVLHGRAGGPAVALGFGPGLTMEGAVLTPCE